ncbi:DUF5684 domain-containing protein [Microbacterium karelineae]|uniref:DUF5684 domain-containing protein n=1 Tax=Microbacterium karelineae TaxID=2654283 RepID=UPI001E48F6E3|nr:DUF5684 domain-containing protein [Microbacterium karelineae]
MNSLVLAQQTGLLASASSYGDFGGTGAFGGILAAFGVSGGVVGFIVYVAVAIGLWKTFSKAGLPGILGIIPIINIIFLLKVARMSFWFALLYIVPIVNVILLIVVAIKVGRNFGHGGAFSFFMLWLLAPIGYLIVGFGGDRYQPETR